MEPLLVSIGAARISGNLILPSETRQKSQVGRRAVAVLHPNNFTTACLRRLGTPQLKRGVHSALLAEEIMVEPHKQLAIAGNRWLWRKTAFFWDGSA